MKKATLATLILTATMNQAALAEHDAHLVIEIKEGITIDPTQQTLSVEDLRHAPAADSGELLRSVTGVQGSRMGGHGLDPIIRGQSQNRLNILLDGATLFGGCPNRMDPASSYAPPASYDSITVIKGSQTVIHGGGGSGGTVLFERLTPRMDDPTGWRGDLGAGYKGNSDTQDAYADVTVGRSLGFARAIGQYTDAGNYEDGDGNETRTAYEQRAGTLILGYTPDHDNRLEFSAESTRESDVLYAGAGMDAPESANDTLRLRFERHSSGMFNHIKAEGYSSQVEHVMDNFSLRPNAGMKMSAPSTSDTYGARISAGMLQGEKTTWTFGADLLNNNRDARRYSGMAVPLTTLQSYLWPDVTIEQIGLFAEAKDEISSTQLVRFGLRYDRVTSGAAAATTVTSGGSTPDTLYNNYYGITANDVTEHNVGGFLRYEQNLGDHNRLFTVLSRSVRSADANERFMASNNTMASMRWIGNPDIEAERHHQAEIGMAWQTTGWEASASVFYNDVSDYILRDRARGQNGILLSDGATIYRNVDARLMGAEAETRRRISQEWSAHASVAYVHATNTDDDLPLAQTPPLEGRLGVDYRDSGWGAGAELIWAARQMRADDDSTTGTGLDAQQTPGFGVLNLYASRNIGEQSRLKVGIDNVFDKTYAYHVNRANSDPFNTDPVLVNEPGRALWVRANTKF